MWLTSANVLAMADALEMSEQTFLQRFVVGVGGRLSLREADNGACLLLDGSAECMVYAQRPQQCRDFPEWSCFESDDRAWQLATEYCPGIHRVPSAEVWALGRPKLQALYQGLRPSMEQGNKVAPCLQNPGRREASSLEVDRFLARYRPTTSETCPALNGDLCIADDARPLACRNLGPEQLQEAMFQVQQLAEELGYPWSRGEWCTQLLDRAEAWRRLVAKLPWLDV